jgi:hypothetical protein
VAVDTTTHKVVAHIPTGGYNIPRRSESFMLAE